ncbi:MAG: L,D-transpeptidase family protein [Planctomycetota bacterium]
MARYPLGSQGKRRDRTRNRVYTILALFIIAVIIALTYGPGPFGKNKDETVEILPEAKLPEADETRTYSVMEPEPEPEIEPVLEPDLPKIELVPAVEPNPEAAELIAEAMALLNEKPNRIIDARERLNEVLRIPMSGQQRAFVKDQLSELADKWLFSNRFFPQDKLCESLQIRPGDQLRIIGQQFKVPYEILMKINNISRPEALQVGATIKVINGPFHAKIYRSTFTMDLYLQNTFIRSFPVGLGKPGMETPTGLWRVKADGKLIEPPWPDPVSGKILQPEDPDYALGSRWVGLEGLDGDAKGRTGFGIHGTKESETIGTADSRGCIRLHNGNVIFVYDLLVPIHSLVRIEE